MITAAMATLTLGLSLHGVTGKPHGQTRAATAGPDVVASSVGFTGPSKEISARSLGHFAALADAPGVTASSGPYPVAWPALRAHGIAADVMAEGRGEASAAVDQPKVLQGSWMRAGGVVMERAFADALGVRVGDHVTLDGRPFQVTGIAVTAAVPVFSQVCFYGGCSGPDGRSLALYHATIRLRSDQSGPWSGPPDPGNGRVSEVLLVITVAMVILAAANATFTTWATVLGARRFTAIARSLGATPQQAVAGLLTAQLLPALVGALVGIPAGTAVYRAVQNGGPQGSPPAWWLLAMVAGRLVAVAGLTVIPARIAAGQPVAENLQVST